MKTFSALKRVFLMILCATMLLCFASCKKAEENFDFVPEKNDVSVGEDDLPAGTENDDISNAPQKGEDEKTPAQDQSDDSEKPDADPKPDEKPDTDAKPDEEKPTEDPKKDSEKESCSHKWKNATCEAPKTCSKCGATEGEAAGHKWKAGNCEAPKTCTVCGATDGDQPVHKYKKGLCSCGAREWGYGSWTYVKDEDKTIYVATLNFDKGEISSFEYHSEDTFEYDDEADEEGDEEADNEDTSAPNVQSYIYKGVKYLQYEGESDLVTYTINGETITVRLLGGSFTMSKSGKTKATVTEVDGLSPSLYIAVGVTFEYGN